MSESSQPLRLDQLEWKGIIPNPIPPNYDKKITKQGRQDKPGPQEGEKWRVLVSSLLLVNANTDQWMDFYNELLTETSKSEPRMSGPIRLGSETNGCSNLVLFELVKTMKLGEVAEFQFEQFSPQFKTRIQLEEIEAAEPAKKKIKAPEPAHLRPARAN